MVGAGQAQSCARAPCEPGLVEVTLSGRITTPRLLASIFNANQIDRGIPENKSRLDKEHFEMSDRTQLAFGRTSISVPRLTKRIVEVAVITGLSGLAALVILGLNNVLTARSGFTAGFDLWMQFIRRSDILGTIILTAIVAVAYVNWQRDQPPGGRR